MEDDTYYSRTQVFEPTKKPYLPIDMIFYENESSWKNLYKQRISQSVFCDVDDTLEYKTILS